MLVAVAGTRRSAAGPARSRTVPVELKSCTAVPPEGRPATLIAGIDSSSSAHSSPTTMMIWRERTMRRRPAERMLIRLSSIPPYNRCVVQENVEAGLGDTEMFG
jgi:hypothetical protein